MTTIGCAKKNQPVNTAGDGRPVAETSSRSEEGESVEVRIAEGEVRELLLALQRVHFSFDDAAVSKASRDALDEAARKLIALPEVALYGPTEQ